MALSMTKQEGKNPLSVELPEDIIEEILHRIPTEYLVRWKTVSKGWKSMMESSHLAEKQLCLHQKLYGAEEFKITVEGSNSRGFVSELFTKFKGMRSTKMDSESEAFPRVPGSCNGLVCVYDLVYINIYNPIIGVMRTLAPKGTILSVGFGRDVVTRAYKVVVAYKLDDDRVGIMVFDLSTSKWRPRYKTAGPVPLSFSLVNSKRNPVFVNSSLFWLCSPAHSEILVMNLHTETFRTVSQSTDIDVSSSNIYMWRRDDRLCVSDLTLCKDSDVWVLVQDDATKRWERTKFASVDTAIPTVIPPYKLHSAWFSPTLVSPYQS